MRADGHSQTALNVALRRAAHQMFDDKPLVLDDPFAVPLVLRRYAEHLRRTPAARRAVRPYSSDIRAWVVARSRFADDSLAASAASITQALVLGAGLDTFALRHGSDRLRVFEVDHPATQAWKRELLREAEIAWPANAAFVPQDFEGGGSLEDALAESGFDFDAVTAVTWLGVVMYLTRDSFAATLRMLGKLPRRSTLVLDIYQPRETLPEREQLMLDSLVQRVAQAGEPFRLFLTPDEAAAALENCGFCVVSDLGAEELNARYFNGRTDGLRLHSATARLLLAERR